MPVSEQGGDKEPAPLPVRPVKPSGYEMLGVFLREVAALILVFAPLDKLIAEGVVPTSWWCATFLSSSVLFLLGVALEQMEGASHSGGGGRKVSPKEGK
jgi:hypothetical protein